jgi:hypothetical protein
LVPNGQASSGGLSFGDILDAVNPLQHIPIVSTLVRAVTGSQISAASQIAGDTLYGALLPGGAVAGLVSSAADVAMKQMSGRDIGQYVLGAVSGSSASSAPPATPLTPIQAAANSAPPHIPATPLDILTRNAGATNAQYQRAQAFDTLNSKLVKMAV